MSHSITVTRTTTTTSSSIIILNSGYLKTIPGILKLVELLIGIVVVGIVGYYYPYFLQYRYYYVELLYFLLISVTLMIGTFLNLLGCILSLQTATILPKTLYEYLYHGFGFLLYLSAGITLFIPVNKWSKNSEGYEAIIAAAVMGLVNAGLYLVSTIFAYRSYRLG